MKLREERKREEKRRTWMYVSWDRVRHIQCDTRDKRHKERKRKKKKERER